MSTPNLAGLSAGLMIWKTFAAMVRPIEAATAVLTSALTKDCGARGCTHRISKTCRPRTRSRAWPSPTQFVGMRRPKVDQPARRAAQSLQDQCFGRSPSTHASLRVVQVGMDDADEAEPSCSARRGGQEIALDVNMARERGLLGSSTRIQTRTPVAKDQTKRYFGTR